MAAKLVWTLALLAAALASAEPLGSLTSVEEYPSIGQVEVNTGSVWVQECAASIITNRHVLSLASCFSGVDYRDESRRIRLGSSHRGQGGTVFGVEVATPHFNYGLLGSDSDIAVIRLSYYLTFGPTLQQAAILGQGIELPLGLAIQHTGWGTTAEGGEESSDDLYTVQLYVHEPDSCLIKYIPEGAIVTENMLCAGLGITRGRDLGWNDVGAPLYFENTLVGLLAFGRTADDDFPVVATSVGAFTQWIINTAV